MEGGRGGRAQIETIHGHMDETYLTPYSSPGGFHMPLVCLLLCLVLGMWESGVQDSLALPLGHLCASRKLGKQWHSHCPTVAINDPEAKLEIPAFSGRF